jgi:hypothetical protein
LLESCRNGICVSLTVQQVQEEEEEEEDDDEDE